MTAIRIGDTERDAAINALANHYATGRLTKDEYDERADRVNSARFDDDLAPLFADLPTAAPARDVAEPTARRGRRPHPAVLAAPLLRLAPVVMIAAIALVTTAIVFSPWLLLGVLWFACAAFGRGHGCHYHRTWAGMRQPGQRA